MELPNIHSLLVDVILASSNYTILIYALSMRNLGVFYYMSSMPSNLLLSSISSIRQLHCHLQVKFAPKIILCSVDGIPKFLLMEIVLEKLIKCWE